MNSRLFKIIILNIISLSVLIHLATYNTVIVLGFPGGSGGKESACNAGDPGLIPGSGRSLQEGTGNPLQYSCLGNPMDRGAWPTTLYGSQRV